MFVRSIEDGEFFYNLVVMDCQMPVKDGYVACCEIRELLRNGNYVQPYIAACTGNTEESQIQKTWDHLFDELVPKPASVELLKAILT